MGFFFNYKTKNNARKFALKSFKMSVIIESEEEVEIEGQDFFYSWLLVQDVISGHKFIEVMYIKRGKDWINRVSLDDKKAFIEIGMAHNQHGRLGGIQRAKNAK